MIHAYSVTPHSPSCVVMLDGSASRSMCVCGGGGGQDKMSLNVFYSSRTEERLSEGDGSLNGTLNLSPI